MFYWQKALDQSPFPGEPPAHRGVAVLPGPDAVSEGRGAPCEVYLRPETPLSVVA